MKTYRIVVGVDGSAGGDRALRWAAAEAEARDGTVQAVMAWTPDITTVDLPITTPSEEIRATAERVLGDAVRAGATEFPNATIATEVVEGRAAEVLTRAAEAADLLVLGSHGHGRVHHVVLGSVTEECVRAGKRPVVVVPVELGSPAEPTAAVQKKG